MRTKTAILRVWWAGGVLPPDLFVGNIVCGVGKIITYDNGESFRISDALPLRDDEEWRHIMAPIFQRLFMFARDPAEWAPKQVMQMYMKKRGWKGPLPANE